MLPSLWDLLFVCDRVRCCRVQPRSERTNSRCSVAWPSSSLLGLRCTHPLHYLDRPRSLCNHQKNWWPGGEKMQSVILTHSWASTKKARRQCHRPLRWTALIVSQNDGSWPHKRKTGVPRWEYKGMPIIGAADAGRRYDCPEVVVEGSQNKDWPVTPATCFTAEFE